MADEKNNPYIDSEKLVRCSSCNGDSFYVLSNVYAENQIPENHYELVCTKCRKGFIFRMLGKRITKDLE